jgi:hypothetical protein
LLDSAPAAPLATIFPGLSSASPRGSSAFRRLQHGRPRYRRRDQAADPGASCRCRPAESDRAVRVHERHTGTQRVTASLNRYPVFRWLNWITRNQMPPLQSVYSSVSLDNCAVDTVSPGFREDVVTQNQLTLITVVRPGRRSRPGRDVGHRLVLEAVGAGRIAHRHQHDSFRQVAVDR